MFCVCFFFIHDSCYLSRCQNIKSDHNFTISLRVWILCHELMHSIHSLQFVLILSGKASGSTVLAGTFCISFIFCIVFCRLMFVFSFFHLTLELSIFHRYAFRMPLVVFLLSQSILLK